MSGSPYIAMGADISQDGRYRYLLWREWRGSNHQHWRWIGGAKDGAGHDLGAPKACLFVMLNPSTADGERDDPTVRRCVGFAKTWGYDRLEVANLFAYRATSPTELVRMNDADEPYGVRNQAVIEAAAARAGLIVCAWGNHGTHLGHDQTVVGWLDGWGLPLMALGTTRAGHPRHPLSVSVATPLMVFVPRRRAA